jgi:hypothetical protein
LLLNKILEIDLKGSNIMKSGAIPGHLAKITQVGN